MINNNNAPKQVIFNQIIGQTINKNAPNSIEQPINLRCSGPKICRKICGITKPTKPINPLTATEAPIAIETDMIICQ